MKAASAILDAIQELWMSLVPCIEESERPRGSQKEDAGKEQEESALLVTPQV